MRVVSLRHIASRQIRLAMRGAGAKPSIPYTAQGAFTKRACRWAAVLSCPISQMMGAGRGIMVGNEKQAP